MDDGRIMSPEREPSFSMSIPPGFLLQLRAGEEEISIFIHLFFFLIECSFLHLRICFQVLQLPLLAGSIGGLLEMQAPV